MKEHDIWFSTLRLSNKIKLKLLKRYGSTENIWNELNNGSQELTKILGKDNINFNKSDVNCLKDIMLKNEIKLTLYNDNNYPKKLENIEDAPAALFYRGNIERLNEGFNISIVGSRSCTSYGINVTKIVAEELTKHNVGVISGLARGIDTFAHRTAIDSNGYTAAVLGCGIDIIYPSENRKLYNDIIENGCVISEFLPGTAPLNYNFPIRNRIISGLSNIVIIIEAGYKSGSLITATTALEQGKDVFAVPGQIFSKQSKGTNKLIKDGAYPLTAMEDVFELLNMNYVPNINAQSKMLNKFEEKLYAAISDSPVHIDDIIKLTNIDIKHLYELLFDLQLKNEIMCLAGNYYVKISNKI